MRMETGWISGIITIATDDDLTPAIDLGTSYDELIVYVPTITSSTVAIHVAQTLAGTYSPLYLCNVDGTEEAVLSGAGTGNFYWKIPFGFQFLKIATAAGQAANRTFKVKGYKRE